MRDPTGRADPLRRAEINGPEIRRARESAQMTQEELAVRLGVSARTVSNWEHSSTIPRNRIGALSDLLGVLHEQSELRQPLLSQATPAELVAELARRFGDTDDDKSADGGDDGPRIPGPREQH